MARARVTVGFLIAAVAFWLARPSWRSLGYGALIAAGGETLRVWAAGHLRKGLEVTRSGPYRLTRHPLYCGSFVIGLGFAVAAADYVAAGMVIAYLTITLLVAIRLEEATLRQAFGDEFQRYSRGKAEASGRRFSFEQMMTNGEHQALLGFLGGLGILGLKAWLITY